MVKVISADCIDGILFLVQKIFKSIGGNKEVNITLTNPLNRFPIFNADIDLVARCAAESIYLISGMNMSDFIWEFRGGEDPRIKPARNPEKSSSGTRLRFCGIDYENERLGYNASNALRYNKARRGIVDQLALAIEYFRLSRLSSYTADIFIPLSFALSSSDIHGIWLRFANKKLNMTVSCGTIQSDMCRLSILVSSFACLQQFISDAVSIPLGELHIAIGNLHSDTAVNWNIKKCKQCTTCNFGYPVSHFTIRDIDNMNSLLIEFVSRLDSNTLTRANPFDGDDRVQMYNDYAELFRAWKAHKLGNTTASVRNVYHPQLKCLLQGENKNEHNSND